MTPPLSAHDGAYGDTSTYAAGIVVGSNAAADPEPERRDTPRDRPSGTRRWYWAYCVYATLSIAAILALGATPAGPLAALTLGATAPICIGLGVWLHRPRAASAWLMYGAVIVVSAAARAITEASPDLFGSVAFHFIGLLPYLIAMWATTKLLRARRGREQPGAVVDGVLVTLAATLLIWPFLAVPSAQLRGAGLDYVITATAFPLASTVLVYRTAQLALTRVVHVPAFKLLLAALGATLGGDVLFAIRDAGYVEVSLEMVNNSYLLIAVFLSLAALHPSMVKLTERAEIVPARLNRARIIVLGVAMATPIAVIAIRPPAGALERVPLTMFGVAIVALVMWRVFDAIQQYARSEGRLAHAATHDSLTGLPNRAYLLTEIKRLLGRRDRGGLALFFCDLDRFKHVNDTWGHGVGDELLVQVASRLVDASGAYGGTVARIGGDEFVVLCKRVHDVEQARLLAQRTLAAFAQPFQLSVGEFHMSPSVGVSWCPPKQHCSAEDLIRHADTAMYVAKSDDAHVAVFDDSMQDAAARRLQLENELHGAVRRGELSVHYQPVVDIHSGEIAAFEALVRWDHPTRGHLSPGEFIPVAEETGTVVEIGDFVLTEVTAALGRWQATDPRRCPSIAVNVSARQLRDRGFADHVEALLDLHGVPAHRLCVEITETVILDTSPVTSEQLERLSRLGVAIAADDFGTGYSSLSYLKKFPVDRVKIDQGFVAGLDASGGKRTDDVAIVDAVLAMASALGLQVVAEGVETETQRAHLASRGCLLAQGWLFSPPVPLEEATEMLGRGLPLQPAVHAG